MNLIWWGIFALALGAVYIFCFRNPKPIEKPALSEDDEGMNVW